MIEKRKVGRPSIAAKSEDEAIHMVLTGRAPKRGRNDLERAAMSKGRNEKRGGGRYADPLSKTQQAAQLAAYLVQAEGVSFREAVRQAAKMHSADVANVRKYAHKAINGPTVTIKTKATPMFAQLVPGGVVEANVPLLVSVADAAGNDQSGV